MKIQAEIENNNFIIYCPKCRTPYKFTMSQFGKYFQKDEEDTFELSEGRLRPIFVCLSDNCNFEDNLHITNL